MIHKAKLNILIFLISFVAYGQTLEIPYILKFNKKPNGAYYTDTTIILNHKSIPNQAFKDILIEKYATKKLPILMTDSTTYIISYSHFHRKRTLWYTIKFEHNNDSINIKLFNIQLQSAADHNFPSPEKTPLEKIYEKYITTTHSKKQKTYEWLFIDIEQNIFNTRNELIELIQKK